MMSDRFARIRGMRDIFASDLRHVVAVEDAFVATLQQHSYEQIRTPLIEQTTLFARGIGETTDAVSKEMYTFSDAEGNPISLRPEGTASTVRAVIEGNFTRGNNPKLWYSGRMFRHERPQQGRYREFYSVGAEVFGYEGPDVDAELIAMVDQVWERLGLKNEISLQLNSLGSTQTRMRYRDELVSFLRGKRDKLDEDSLRRLDINPLRILDSKNAQTQNLLHDAPLMSDFYDDESHAKFTGLQELLRQLDIEFEINPRLVRGLDYYNHAVFEWNTERLGAQKQLGGGGRYDGLVELLGGAPCKAAGFGIGIDRVALLREQVVETEDYRQCDVFVVAVSPEQTIAAAEAANVVRENSRFIVRQQHGYSKLKTQMKHADRSGAIFALMIGELEQKANLVTIKYLRDDREQLTVPVADVTEHLLIGTR